MNRDNRKSGKKSRASWLRLAADAQFDCIQTTSKAQKDSSRKGRQFFFSSALLPTEMKKKKKIQSPYGQGNSLFFNASFDLNSQAHTYV